jgi:anti-repressor protein
MKITENPEKELITLNDRNEAVTSSRMIAEVFEKDHGKVLRAIRSLECTPEFTEANFGLSEYEDTTGRTLPEYVITKDGFVFLAMGFTGKKAAKFKEKYIQEFNRKEAELQQLRQPQLPKSRKDMYLLAYHQECKIEEQEKLLQVANEQVQQATLQLQEAQPKIEVYRQIMDAEDAVDLGVAAKEFGLGKNNFMRLLRDHKILITIGDMKNTPYQVYSHHFKVVSKTIPGLNKLSYKTYVRATGLAWLAKGFAKNPEVLQRYK